MNYELETFQELRQINAKISRFIVWHVIVCILFVIPACLVIIWIGINLAHLNSELAKVL